MVMVTFLVSLTIREDEAGQGVVHHVFSKKILVLAKLGYGCLNVYIFSQIMLSLIYAITECSQLLNTF